MTSILYAITSLACDKLKLNCAVDDAVDWRLSLARFWESNFNKRVGKYESARSRPPLQASSILLSTHVPLCSQRVNDRFFYVVGDYFPGNGSNLPSIRNNVLPLNVSCLARCNTRKLFGCQGTGYNIRANTFYVILLRDNFNLRNIFNYTHVNFLSHLFFYQLDFIIDDITFYDLNYTYT